MAWRLITIVRVSVKPGQDFRWRLLAAVEAGMGQRFDSWGKHGLGDDTATGWQAFEDQLAEAGENWKHAPYQLEVFGGNGISTLLTNGAWDWWAWDETVRFAINEHFSAIALKDGYIPCEAGNGGDCEDAAVDANFCNCADGGADTDENCVSDDARRLLQLMGPRISVQSISFPPSLPADSPFPFTVRLENDGNAPLYHLPTPGLRLWDVGGSDWANDLIYPYNPIDTDFRQIMPRSGLCVPSWTSFAGGCMSDADTSEAHLNGSTNDEAAYEYPCTQTQTTTAVEHLVTAFTGQSGTDWLPSPVTATTYELYILVQFGTDGPDLDMAMDLNETLEDRNGPTGLPGADHMWYLGSVEVTP